MQKGDNSLSLRTEKQSLDKNTKNANTQNHSQYSCTSQIHNSYVSFAQTLPYNSTDIFSNNTLFFQYYHSTSISTYLCGGQDLKYKIIFNCSHSGLDTAFWLICKLYWVQRHFHKLAFLPLHVFCPLARPGLLSLQITK